MNTVQLSLIRDSWACVAPNADAAGQVFYANLFAIDPALRRLFPDDIQPQAHKLMAMLNLLIGQLENADVITRELTGLARRHARYGVQPDQFNTVGLALIQTLRDGLGDRWTPDVQLAWGALYQTVAGAMIALGKEQDLPAVA
ncbi:globin family protein [Spirosoma rhododendri]|uniref:Hemin receptor n=1 Tax=Spirosoma rhododendri TaxID=2728024 RepID=A0A7L5DGK3_9BACT|nr:globin family protein [Spirosoma rhododendri]QJD77374.1 hemin receptor [Spirosoma rhododendri]